MRRNDIQLPQVLAEVLRFQRWAGGGDAISAARIFGLTHCLESVLEQEGVSCVSRVTQDKVENLLESVEAGKQPVDGPMIKDRLREMDVRESDAAAVMRLCVLEGRFNNGVDRIVSAQGSHWASLKSKHANENDWHGALHYVELYDSTEGARKKLHGAFCPCVPRLGEIVEPEAGSPMKVVEVCHVAVGPPAADSGPSVRLVPHVVLEAIEGDRDEV